MKVLLKQWQINGQEIGEYRIDKRNISFKKGEHINEI